jgi:LPS export ABC transporter protein LptC
VTARTFAGLLLAGIAAFGAWRWQLSLQHRQEVDPSISVEVQGVYLREATVVSPGPDGRPLYRLTAAEMTQPLDAASLGVRDVYLEYESAGPGRWTVQSDRGDVALDWRDIRLSGNVSVAWAGESAPATVLETGSLSLDAVTHRASTSDRVVLHRGSGQIEGTGMSVDLMAGTVALESRVNGYFAP